MEKTYSTSCGCSKEDPLMINRNNENVKRFCIQIGLFQTYNKALAYQLELFHRGYLTDIGNQGTVFTIIIGDFRFLDDAVEYEYALKLSGFDTILISEEYDKV